MSGRRMRVDTTVVETNNIHYPTESSLMGGQVDRVRDCVPRSCRSRASVPPRLQLPHPDGAAAMAVEPESSLSNPLFWFTLSTYMR